MTTLTSLFFYNDEKIYKQGFDFDILEKLLVKNGFTQIKYNQHSRYEYVDFMFTYLYPPSTLYHTSSRLSNNINNLYIKDKQKLYQLSLQKSKSKTLDYMVDTYIFNEKHNYRNLFNQNKSQNKTKNKKQKNIWIIKKNLEFGGKGNFIVSTYNQFITIKNKLKNDFIICKYITNPLLFNQLKFHLRVYFINYIDQRNEIRAYMSKYGFILTAKEPYINDNFENQDIHDSHFKSTATDYIYPTDFNKTFGVQNTNIVNNKIIEILKYLTEIQKLYNYPDSDSGFSIIGCDFMVTDNLEVKLLETNNRTLLAAKTDKYRKFFGNYLFKNIYNEIVCDVFNLDSVPVKEKFIKI
jgi:hypothetical protein